ncbi:hypothetical protein BC749_1224 [Flavobacterium araucananum]|uniref:Uncharacterized protein n=1 Tax=Flavobacterium araucananum TaxID=946678 RepID=A0A227P5W2_9FLAO|nr:hypothetical protein [Flavobacterium araucananum]OXG05317.1 hypothetical protein B0A64_13165 [Flavobacterium araucananum]PWJ89666.1 hypothetical protein BC749_1224 [Flavobacterium araucananum]
MKKDKQKDKVEKKKKKPFTPPKPEEEKKKKNKKKVIRQSNPFIRIDRGGNFLTNFFSNFFRQLRNPTKTGISGLLGKFLVIKIDPKEKNPAQQPAKPADIMGPVKTVLRNLNYSGDNNLSPAEKESLRQRTNQPLKIDFKTGQNEQQQENMPKKKGLGM